MSTVLRIALVLGLPVCLATGCKPRDSAPISAQERPDCVPFGSLAAVVGPNGDPAGPRWVAATALAQGALQGAVAPGLVEPFRPAPIPDGRMCARILFRGAIGTVGVFDLRAEIAYGPGPLLFRGALFAVGPDSAATLLGTERGVTAPFHNLPEIARLNAVLGRYHLLGVDMPGLQLASAEVMFGPPRPGTLEYHRCTKNAHSVRVIANLSNGYRREDFLVEFLDDGAIRQVLAVDSLPIGC